MDDSLICETRGALATLTLNRVDVHNAFDEHLIATLTSELERLGSDPDVRVVVLAAAGRSFSAGADLNWMRRMADYGEAENRDDALRLARLMQTLDGLPKPTVAKVQGAAFGGGVGLVACCDIVIAARTALFSLSEVRLGLIPAVISPYVVKAMGARQARRYFLTAERFDAGRARDLGLVHEVVEQDALDDTVTRCIAELLQGAPGAQAEAKTLIEQVAPLVAADLVEHTAGRIARVRAAAEGREGVVAFLDKRAPAWAVD